MEQYQEELKNDIARLATRVVGYGALATTAFAYGSMRGQAYANGSGASLADIGLLTLPPAGAAAGGLAEKLLYTGPDNESEFIIPLAAFCGAGVLTATAEIAGVATGYCFESFLDGFGWI